MSDEKGKPEQDPTTGRFLPGNNGGPGRRIGSRKKLGEAFICDMFEAWTSAGPDVIARVIREEPSAFLRSMVAILPKEMDINVNKFDAMTDEQLRTQFLAALRDANALGLDFGAGKPANADSAAQAKPAGPVSSLH